MTMTQDVDRAITMDVLARHVPENGALFRHRIANLLDDRAAMANIHVLAGKLPDPADAAIYAAGGAADTFYAAAMLLHEWRPDAPVRELLAAAHGMARFAVALTLLEAADRAGAGGARPTMQ